MQPQFSLKVRIERHDCARQRLDAGYPEDTLRIALECLEVDPNDLGALELVARAAWKLQDFELVIEASNRLTQINPAEPGYVVLRESCLMAKAIEQEAERRVSLPRAVIHFPRSVRSNSGN